MYARFVFLIAFDVFYSGFLMCQSLDTLKTYSLKEITVTASRFGSSNSDLPTSLEIIDSKQISNSNGNRLSDVLKNSGKVFIKTYGSTPMLQTISMNGLGAEHTLILIDGVKLNSFQNSVVDLSLINLDFIDRIEILNNGSSSIFGSDAIGGVINIIPENKISPDTSRFLNFRLLLSKGSYSTDRFGLKLSKSADNFYGGVSFSQESSDGNYTYEFDDGVSKQIKERENAAYKIKDLTVNLQYIVNRSIRIKYFSVFANQNKEIPGIETGTPPAFTSQQDKNWNNILIAESELNPFVSFINKVNYQNNLMYYKTEPVINSHYKNLVYSVSSDLNLKFKDFSTAAGFEFVKASLQSNEIENLARRNLLSFFISSGITLFNSLKFYPSSRFDLYSDLNEKVFTYKLGLNYQPFSEFKLSFKANIGKNFRAPTFNDLYWKESGNKNLKPEKSINGELGICYYFTGFIEGNLDISYTQINATDKIVWLPQRNFLWMPINIAESVSKNYFLSVNLIKNFNEDFKIGLNAGTSLIRSIKTNENFNGDPTKDKYFPYIPLESSKFTLLMDYKNLTFNLFFNHYDKRYSDFENKKTLNPYNLLDGNISAKVLLFEFLTEMKFEINNILNKNYQVIPGYPMPLRNFKLTLIINY